MPKLLLRHKHKLVVDRLHTVSLWLMPWTVVGIKRLLKRLQLLLGANAQ